MATFVHTADIHFDTPFTARFTPEQASLRRKEVMRTFQNICEAAKVADLFLVAGDLFDGRFVSPETVAFLKRCFAEMPDTQVCLVAGNHDPYPVYAKENFGENVHLFGTEMAYLDLPEKQVRVHGRSFSNQYEESTLLTPLPIKEDWCNILLIHGEVVALGGESVYNPLEKPVLEQSGVDYAALGHIHQYSGIQRLGGMYYAYPGIPEGRGFDEAGERGYLVGTIEKGAVQATWKPVAKREFVLMDLDVSACGDSLEVVDKIRTAVEDAGKENIYRICLVGTAAKDLIKVESLQEQLKEAAFSIELRDETRPAYPIESLAEENSLRGAFVKEMLSEIAQLPEEEKKMGELALSIGLDAMERGMLR